MKFRKSISAILATVMVLSMVLAIIPATVFAAIPEYTVDPNTGNASVAVPYGYTWNIDSVGGAMKGEDVRVFTSNEAYANGNPNWAITLFLEKKSDNTYVALRDAIVGPGSAANANIDITEGKVALVVHSSSSKPTDAESYPNWIGKVVAMAVKAGDIIVFEGVDFAAGTVDNATATVVDPSAAPSDPTPDETVPEGYILVDAAAGTGTWQGAGTGRNDYFGVKYEVVDGNLVIDVVYYGPLNGTASSYGNGNGTMIRIWFHDPNAQLDGYIARAYTHFMDISYVDGEIWDRFLVNTNCSGNKATVVNNYNDGTERAYTIENKLGENEWAMTLTMPLDTIATVDGEVQFVPTVANKIDGTNDCLFYGSNVFTVAGKVENRAWIWESAQALSTKDAGYATFNEDTAVIGVSDVNMAVGGTVSGMPLDSTTYNHNIADGVVGTDAYGSGWRAFDSRIAHGNNTFDYAIVDMGEVKTDIASVGAHVWNANHSGIVAAKSMRMLASVDGKSWTDLGLLELGAADALPEWKLIKFEKTLTARYIMLEVETTGTFNFVSEVGVFANEVGDFQLISSGNYAQKDSTILVPFVKDGVLYNTIQGISGALGAKDGKGNDYNAYSIAIVDRWNTIVAVDTKLGRDENGYSAHADMVIPEGGYALLNQQTCDDHAAFDAAIAVGATVELLNINPADFAGVVDTDVKNAYYNITTPASFDILTAGGYAGGDLTIVVPNGENNTAKLVTGNDYNYYIAAIVDANGIITKVDFTLGNAEHGDYVIPEGGFFLGANGGHARLAELKSLLKVGGEVALVGVDLEALKGASGQELTGASFSTFHIHNLVETVYVPTCKDGGYTADVCSCGMEENVRDEKEATGIHNNVTTDLGGIFKTVCSVCGTTTFADAAGNAPVAIPVSHNNAFSWGAFEAMLVTGTGKTLSTIPNTGNVVYWIMYKIEKVDGKYVATDYLKDTADMQTVAVPEGGFLMYLYSSDTGYAIADNGALLGKTLILSDETMLDKQFTVDTDANPPRGYIFVVDETVVPGPSYEPGLTIEPDENTTLNKGEADTVAGLTDGNWVEGATSFGEAFLFMNKVPTNTDIYPTVDLIWNLESVLDINTVKLGLYSEVNSMVGYPTVAGVEISADGINWEVVDCTHDIPEAIYSADYKTPNGTIIANVKFDDVKAQYVKVTLKFTYAGYTDKPVFEFFGMTEAEVTYVEAVQPPVVDPNKESIAVDGDLADTGWVADGWITVNKDNGTFQGGIDSLKVVDPASAEFTYKFQMRTDDTKLYVAAVYEDITNPVNNSTKLRLWLNTSPEATVYTHFYDVFMADVTGTETGITAKYNTSTTANSGANIADTTAVGVMKIDGTKVYYEFSVDLAEFGGEDGFAYFFNAGHSNAGTNAAGEAASDNIQMLYPAVEVPTEGDKLVNFPYKTWCAANEGKVVSADIALGEITTPVYPPEYKVDEESGNASVDAPYGYTWAVDSVGGKIGGEDVRIFTSNDAYAAGNPNWAITLFLEKQEDGSYVALRDAIVTPGSAANAGIDIVEGTLALVVHSASSKPTDAETYPNWYGKVVAMSVKAGDRFMVSDLEAGSVTVYAMLPGEEVPTPPAEITVDFNIVPDENVSFVTDKDQTLAGLTDGDWKLDATAFSQAFLFMNKVASDPITYPTVDLIWSFSEAIEINTVKLGLYSEVNSMVGFPAVQDVLVSDDGENWYFIGYSADMPVDDYFAEVPTPNGTQIGTVSFNNVTTKYVKVVLNYRFAGYESKPIYEFFGMTEASVELVEASYDDAFNIVPDENTVLNKGEADTVAGLTDGNWVEGATSFGEAFLFMNKVPADDTKYPQVDLVWNFGDLQKINTVKLGLYSEVNSMVGLPGIAKVQVSENGVYWTDVWFEHDVPYAVYSDEYKTPSGTIIGNITFDAVEAKYVKVTLEFTWAGYEGKPIFEFFGMTEAEATYVEPPKVIEIGFGVQVEIPEAGSVDYTSSFESDVLITVFEGTIKVDGVAVDASEGYTLTAGEHTVTFESESGVATYSTQEIIPGSYDFPLELPEGETTVTVNGDGTHYVFVAEEDTTLTITMTAGEWFYKVDNITAEVYGDWRNYNDDPVVATTTIDVAAGDKIIILIAMSDYEAEGEVSFEIVIGDDEPVYKKGDVDGDGEIKAKDYMMVKRAFLGTYILEGPEIDAADVDGDGEIKAKDYMMVKRHFLGTYIIEGWEEE